VVAPLTKTRMHKIKILKELSSILYEIAWYPMGSLDRMDIRKLKEILKKLNELHERAKPA
jgi:hypothetical protein